MGYSITIKLNNKKELNKVYKILEKEFKPISILFEDYYKKRKFDSKEIIQGVAPCIDGYVSFLNIGFSYSSWVSEIQRYYVYKLLSMLSEKFKSKNYYYDDEEMSISELKYYNSFNPMNKKAYKKKDIEEIEEIIKKECNRLKILL